MLRANGLYGYIQNNNLKSLALFALFLVVGQMIGFALWVGYGLSLVHLPAAGKLSFALQMTRNHFIEVLLICLVWVALAYLFYGRMTRAATGAHEVERVTEARLYNITENLSIMAGVAMPRLEIIETAALNAYAMGFGPNSSTIAVTRGLLRELSDAEVEAVIAHEITHIKNRDVRLVAFATICSGITFRFYEYFLRPLVKPGIRTLALAIALPTYPLALGALMLSVAATSLVTAFALRFAISRTRELIADAGSFELTKNPEALASALLKIAGRDQLRDIDLATKSMMISGVDGGWFTSHPTVAERVAAIRQLAHQIGLAPVVVPAPASSGGGFSFTGLRSMEFAKWVEHPMIVIPVFVAGVLIFSGMRQADMHLHLFPPIDISRYDILEEYGHKPKHTASGPEHDARSQTTPACFPMRWSAPYTPGNEPFVESRVAESDLYAKGDRNSPLDEGRRWKRLTIGNLNALGLDCVKNTCSKALLSVFKRGIGAYLNRKEKMIVDLDKRYGEPGLRWAQSYYDAPSDRKIKTLMHNALAKGLITRDDYPVTLAMTLDLPPDGFVPCRNQGVNPGLEFGDFSTTNLFGSGLAGTLIAGALQLALVLLVGHSLYRKYSGRNDDEDGEAGDVVTIPSKLAEPTGFSTTYETLPQTFHGGARTTFGTRTTPPPTGR